MQAWFRNSLKDILQTSMTPRSFVWRLSPTGIRYIALTFDDGPDPVYTEKILELLHAHAIKATFFMVGEKVARFPEIVRCVADNGHSLGGHTFFHKEVTQMSSSRFVSDLDATRNAIKHASGKDTRMFRPPRGRFKLTTLRITKYNGYQLVHWARTYSDYKNDYAGRLIDRMRTSPPRHGEIVLLHDNNKNTLTALETVLPEWRRMGAEFVRL